jgi:hypothetical protein
MVTSRQRCEKRDLQQPATICCAHVSVQRDQ